MLRQYFYIIILCLFCFPNNKCLCSDNVCHRPSDDNDNSYCTTDNVETMQQTRYLLYDVNPPEGFNLRRDVYMRFAVLVHKLRQQHSKNVATTISSNSNRGQFKLVLPPWSHLYHWRRNAVPEHYPWSRYFDLNSLRLFAPVIEMHEFFDAIHGKYVDNKNKIAILIDEVYTLQHFEDMFESGNFIERMEIRPCQRPPENVAYFFYDNLTSFNERCLSFHGPATKLMELFNNKNSTARTILINHAEVALHTEFGNGMYWRARRSMRFSIQLRNAAADFRKKHLNSTDTFDGTIMPFNWQDETTERHKGPPPRGGPYLSVHLRRGDFVRGRPTQSVPTLQQASQQIIDTLQQLMLDVVFIATDARIDEYREIERYLNDGGYKKVLRYAPPLAMTLKNNDDDGSVAIIDQIICAHAQYFIGTQESTFTFRIYEEREIMGFPSDTTFNSFCGAEHVHCARPSRWKIVYD